MKNFLKLFGIIIIGVVIGFSMAACDDGSDNGGGNNNSGGGSPFVGTWIGYVQGAQATVIISAGNTWSISVPAGGFYDSGSYSGVGSVATLTSNNIGGDVVGTATAIANVNGTITTINLVLNQNSASPGTYTLTKQ
jgi:hypothetical protein